MAWTQTDVDRLKEAVRSGILTVSYDGPPRRQITYQSLAEMRDLLKEMENDVADATGERKGFRLASFSGGFE